MSQNPRLTVFRQALRHTGWALGLLLACGAALAAAPVGGATDSLPTGAAANATGGQIAGAAPDSPSQRDPGAATAPATPPNRVVISQSPEAKGASVTLNIAPAKTGGPGPSVSIVQRSPNARVNLSVQGAGGNTSITISQ